jgi:hypothetical protein
MERYLQKLKIFLVFTLIFAGSTIFSDANRLFAQTPSIIRHIRFPIWAEVDAYPGTQAAAADVDAEEFSYPIARIKETVPFLIEGLVYGWNFVYVPSDKTRGVEEYFEIEPVQKLADGQKNDGGTIEYSSVWIENNRFNCWIDYTRTPHEIQTYNLWASIQNPAIQGRGYGDLSLGFEGIKLAAQDALKNAVREYYRDLIKNKPKEITGRVLMRKTPLIGITKGQYVINLDFFLECGTISEYTKF